MKYLLILVLALSGCAKEVITGPMGPKGDTGDTGATGPQGVAGTGCTVQAVVSSVALPYGGAIVTCNDNAVLISNGAPGANGAPGPVAAYGIVQKIDPCGDTLNVNDELLLRLADGTLLATVSDNTAGDNTHLGAVTDGNWMTTDGSSCHFSVSTVGSTRTVAWSGGSTSWSI